MVATEGEAIDRLENGKEDYAFVGYASSAIFRAGYPCKFKNVGPPITREQQAYGVRKNSPLKPVLSYHMAKLLESGVVDNVFAPYRTGLRDCEGSVEEDAAIGAEVSFGIFAVLLAGACAATLSAMLELALPKKEVKPMASDAEYRILEILQRLSPEARPHVVEAVAQMVLRPPNDNATTIEYGQC